jgi:hypothetical protein
MHRLGLPALEFPTVSETMILDSTSVKTKHPVKRLRVRARPGKVGANNLLALLSWQPKKATDIWTRSEWTNLCTHLHNGNGKTHFVMGFRDDTGAKRYVRSKRLGVDRAITWSWSSILGTSKSKLAFVPYSTNDRQQSRWGGMDFDAHNPGEADRARELALAAFRCLLNDPALSVILETSGGGGWHVWAISPDFHDTHEWVRSLKSVATLIGAPIAGGVCEIFPPDSLPSRFGKGMRAPGCWNPGTETCSQIVWENVRTSLEPVLSGKSKNGALNSNGLQAYFPDTEKKASFSPSSFPNYHELELLQKFGITQTNSRNDKLAALTGAIFNQVGGAMARWIVLAQFRHKTVSTEASEHKHMASFEELWAGLAARWRETISKDERDKLAQLETDNERDAFRIIRSFAAKAVHDGAADFPIARDNLAERLGITGKGAAGIREKFVRLGIIAKTASYVPNKFATRFKWLPTIATKQSANE